MIYKTPCRKIKIDNKIPVKTGSEPMCSGRVAVPVPLEALDKMLSQHIWLVYCLKPFLIIFRRFILLVDETVVLEEKTIILRFVIVKLYHTNL
jgi:hypothetical protein